MLNKNPVVNATLAAGYIILIVFVISLFADNPAMEGTLLVPMVMISLFVLSAAVMGYLFVYEPLRLHLDNKRDEAIKFFLKTVSIFACFAALFILMLIINSKY